MSVPDELRNIRDYLRSGRFGQREIWERQLEEAADEIARLRAALAWVGQVRPGTSRDGGGGAYVRMTWDEFNAMREAIGLKPIERHIKP